MAYNPEYYQKNKDRYKAANRRSYAKNAGLPYDAPRQLNPLSKKDQQKDRNYKRKFGMTLARYQEMYREHDGLCAICKRWFETLCIDHNHETGDIRGLLCKPCNWAIGLLDENVDRLTESINYLSRFNDSGL